MVARYRLPINWQPVTRNYLLFLGALSTVLGAGLTAVSDTGRIERTTDDGITYTGKVLYPTTADQYDTVLLEVVPLTGDVSDYLDAVRQPDFSDLTQGRVRLLGRRGVNTGTNTALLGAGIQCTRVTRLLDLLASFTD